MKAEEFKVGLRIWFSGEKQPYRIRATDGVRFMVCTKPFNLRHTVIYCIVDFQQQIRGPENLVFGMGAETDEQCQQMLHRIVTGETEISHRHRAFLDIASTEFDCCNHGA